ncbi:hypothetical protein F5B18DRAFT_631505 [Nemania serpens]|nr:hypothetical protein F5B18DRAFT_631505 [Nemania serpens]
MATNSNSPKKRLHDLSAAVGNLENALNRTSPKEYFLGTYQEAFHTLRLILEEKWRGDADPTLRADLDSLSSRTVEVLSRSVDYDSVAESGLSSVQGLRRAVYRLSEWSGRSSYRLGEHLVNMTLQFQKMEPPPRSAWTQDGSDLKPDVEFERLFKEFGALEKDPRNFQCIYELYVAKSYSLLEAACEALSLPADQAYPDARFFDNESRPTYVEYPYGSREFAYGKGSRSGMLSVKLALGAVLTADEVKGFDEERQKAKGDDKRGKKVSQKNQGGEEMGQGNKRRTSIEPPSPKKARSKWGYTMTSVNAAADIEDVLRDSRYTDLRGGHVNRPDDDSLITPTVEARKALLVQNRGDLRRISDDVNKKKSWGPAGTAKLPQSSVERDAWLAHATRKLGSARATIHELINGVNTPTKAKKLRLAAYKLKLIRSLHTAGLLAGEPPASQEDIKDGLQGRLDDWILYEKAWNAAEGHILKRAGLTDELVNTIKTQTAEREVNIARWKEMRNELDEEQVDEVQSNSEGGPSNSQAHPPPNEVEDREENGEEEKGNEENGKEKNREEENGEEENGKEENVEEKNGEEKNRGEENREEENGEEKNGEEENGEDENREEKNGEDENREDENREEENGEKENGEGENREEENREKENGEEEDEEISDPGIYVLTDKEIDNGQTFLQSCLHPRLPNSRDYPLDQREKNRRRSWFEKMPPGWENLPKETAWDRLQYMWVLTYWRFFQLRLLEP